MLTVVPDISDDLLESLQIQLRPLSKRDRRRRRVFWWFCVISWLSGYAGLWYLLAHLASLHYGIALLPLGLVLLFSIGITVGLPFAEFDDEIRFLFDFLHKRSVLHSQLKYLGEQILQEDTRLAEEKKRLAAEGERRTVEKENDVIRIIEQIDSYALIRKVEMLGIEDAIKYKRKWRPEFDDFPTILDQNRDLDQQAVGAIREQLKLVRSTHPEHWKWHRIAVGYSRIGYLDYAWLEWRLKRLRAWEAPEYIPRPYVPRESPEPYEDDIDTETEFSEVIAGETSFQDDTMSATDPTAGRLESGTEIRTGPIPNTESDIQSGATGENIGRPPSSRSERQQSSLFDEISLTEKPLTEVPRQLIGLPKHRTIKVSEKLRQEVDAKKLKIGKMGELAVMEHERSRLRNEQGNVMREIRHVSLTNDAAGYDIQSWDDQNEICIEVKTTVGDFWSNLFFTQNEFEKLTELGEKYYLYRICNFNLETGEGQLFVYAGEKLITDSFEFNSKMYLLSERSH